VDIQQVPVQILNQMREKKTHFIKKTLNFQETVRYFEKYAKPDSKVLKFVQRCTELCWLMVIKEPPMVLVHDQMEGKLIDRNLFSVYTKRGSVVDFVIWPALILYKNGPILSKGVVQGKEDKKQEIPERKQDVKTETVKGDELSEEDALLRTKIVHEDVGDEARKEDKTQETAERKHDVKTETVKGDDGLQNNVPGEDPSMIVHEDVGDKTNVFKVKGNGNQYEQ